MANVFARWKSFFQLAAHKLHVKPLARDLFTRLAEKLTTSEDAERLYFWHEECRATAAAVTELLQKMGTEVVSNVDAYQEFWLTAADLEDSTDPDGNVVTNSVLLTASQTAVEFNWPRTFRQDCSIQIGPGDNVQDHAFVQNLDFNIDGFYVRGVSAGVFELKSRRAVVMPYFSGGSRLKLWIGQFQYDAAAPNNIRFQPSSLVPDIHTKVILRARPEG